MRYVEAFSHHNGEAEWQKREQFEWLTDVFVAPAINIGKGTTPLIRAHVKEQFLNQGWTSEIRLDPAFDLSITAMKDDMAFQMQTGNVSRAFYDLLKLQFLYTAEKIEAAALAVPSQLAAQRIGSNIASFNRVMNELSLFNRVISVPLLLISFE